MRTLNVTLADGCNNDATYSRCQLRNLAGNCGAQDGGAVTFDNGIAQYNNNGCFAPGLPVEFGDFTLTKFGKAVRLDWTTFAELNNDYFTIQRSSDGSIFEDIGEVVATGFSTVRNDYTFTDNFPAGGLQYYRVKQTDFDGKIGFSDVRAIRFNEGDKDRGATVSHEQIRVYGWEEPFVVFVYNSGGVLITCLPDQKGDIELNLDFLSRGVYFLVVQNHLYYDTFRFFR